MLKDDKGAPVRLGLQIGRSGGEGSAYAVQSHPGFVAKIYHDKQLPDKRKAAKLTYLTQRGTPEVRKSAAWPTFLLFDENPRLRGFLMPMISGKEVHQLFGNRDRVIEFPGKNWDFLLNTARNCATAFASVHEVGAVIGDVNEGNLLVRTDGFVSLIDCDSYQISNGSESWTCDVGVPMWTPPELQGRDYKGLVRTPNHDAFGLAVLIFKLLFLGRHPFAGIQIDGSDCLLEDAIKKRLYAYSPSASTYGVRPPPFTFPVAALPQSYSHLFERAFRLDVPRPSAEEWVQALAALQQTVIQCSRDSSHRFPNFLNNCPWCQIAAAGGPLFFVNVQIRAQVNITDNIDATWAAICGVQMLALVSKKATDVKIPPTSATPIDPNIQKLQPIFAFGVLLGVISFLLLITGNIFPGLILGCFAAGMLCEGRHTPEFIQERVRRRAVFQQADSDVSSTLAQVEHNISSYTTAFGTKMAELKQLYERYKNLDREQTVELQKLENNKRQVQLNEFLRAQLISNACIPGIGDTRKRRLLSFGIGSALDIQRNAKIPGFGPSNMSHLINWRLSCEAKFRFDPLKPVPPIEIQRINLKYSTLRSELSSKIKAGPAALSSLNAGSQGRHLQLSGQFEIAVQRRAQATMDLRIC